MSFAGMMLKKVGYPLDLDVKWKPLCRQRHPLCRLKVHSVVTWFQGGSSCKTGVYIVNLFIILKRGCNSRDRKEVSCLGGYSELVPL